MNKTKMNFFNILLFSLISISLTSCGIIHRDYEINKVMPNFKEDLKGSPISIFSSSAYTNRLDFTDVAILFENTSNKDFKYVTFEVVPFNQVHDPVSKNAKLLRLIGPIKPYSNNIQWHCVNTNTTGFDKKHQEYWTGDTKRFESTWLNNLVDYIRIKNITVEYFDGKKVEIPHDKIKFVGQPAKWIHDEYRPKK